MSWVVINLQVEAEPFHLFDVCLHVNKLPNHPHNLLGRMYGVQQRSGSGQYSSSSSASYSCRESFVDTLSSISLIDGMGTSTNKSTQLVQKWALAYGFFRGGRGAGGRWQRRATPAWRARSKDSKIVESAEFF